jgi:hypothetical protein
MTRLVPKPNLASTSHDPQSLKHNHGSIIYTLVYRDRRLSVLHCERTDTYSLSRNLVDEILKSSDRPSTFLFLDPAVAELTTTTFGGKTC